MTEAIERLKELRMDRVRRKQSCEMEILNLQEAIRSLEGIIDGIDISITALVGKNGHDGAGPALLGKYTEMGVTAAVKDVIETGGGPPGLLVPEIMAKLQAEGFKSEAKELYSTVYAVAMRLVQQGAIREGVKDGKRSFMKK